MSPGDAALIRGGTAATFARGAIDGLALPDPTGIWRAQQRNQVQHWGVGKEI